MKLAFWKPKNGGNEEIQDPEISRFAMLVGLQGDVNEALIGLSELKNRTEDISVSQLDVEMAHSQRLAFVEGRVDAISTLLSEAIVNQRKLIHEGKVGPRAYKRPGKTNKVISKNS